MAKENYAFFVGQVRKEPKIIKNENGVEIATFSLTVLRRELYDRNGNLAPRYDKVVVYTLNESADALRQAKTVKLHDIVEVKGSLLQMRTQKNEKCPHCGSTYREQVDAYGINATFIRVAERIDRGIGGEPNPDSSGLKYMMEYAEVSNTVKLIGRVCKDPERMDLADSAFTRYPIACNRKLYKLGSEGEEDHADYLWVYSYDDIGEEDARTLRQNSLIYLDGYAHTRSFLKSSVCPNCGKDHGVKRLWLNVTPRSNEYLENCYLDEASHRNLNALHEERTEAEGEEPR